MPTVTELQNNYNNAIKAYNKAFYDKYEVEIEYWVGDDISGICEVCDMFIDFIDIKYCVDNNVEFDTLHDWYYFNNEHEKASFNLDAYCRLKRDYINNNSEFNLLEFEKQLIYMRLK